MSYRKIIKLIKFILLYTLILDQNAMSLSSSPDISSRIMELISSIEASYQIAIKPNTGDPIEDERKNQELETKLNQLITHKLLKCQIQSQKLLEMVFSNLSTTEKPKIALSIRSNLMSNFVYDIHPDFMEEILYDCLLTAHNETNAQATVILLNSIGNFYSSIDDHRRAIKIYKTINRIYIYTDTNDIPAYANINCARSYAEIENLDQSLFHLEQAKLLIESINGIEAKTLLNLTSINIYLELIMTHQDEKIQLMRVAFEIIERTQHLVSHLNDSRLHSYLNGYTGRLYELNNQFESAIKLTQTAWYNAQNEALTDLYFSCQWQLGRIYKKMNNFGLAIQAYDSALYHLDLHDQQSLKQQNYSEKLNPFSEFSDLLLTRSESAKNDIDRQYYFKKARDLIEKQKSIELTNFLQDSCASQRLANNVDIDDYSPKTAIIYILPLHNRTEFIISHRGIFYRFTQKTNSSDLREKINSFKQMIKKRTTFQFITFAKQLYDLLVQPYEPFLLEHSIDTLVFVPDKLMQDVPLAALYDGVNFLVKNYAIAISPGLTLAKKQRVDFDKSKLLACGISEGTQGFDPLQFVPDEIRSIESITNCKKIINDEFTHTKFAEELLHNNYSFVHIASHGFLAERHSDSYLLTWNSKLSVKQFESILKPNQFRGIPLELLTLSACQSASSYSNTALGLAGIAYNSGVKSVIGSLWFINDQASSELITKFYNNLFQAKRIGKAKALQNAQISLMNDSRYRHPYFWSSFLIIGNWL